MRIYKILSGLVILTTFSSEAQNYYLDLKPGKWNFKPSLYYFSNVMDDRKEKDNAGQVLSDGKIVKAKFKNSLEDDMKNYILNSIEQDTTKIPLIISFDKFSLKETGTTAKHRTIFDFSLKIFRNINDKHYQLYEAKGQPGYDMRGPVPDANEKNIDESLRTTLEAFNEWINKNPDQPPLVSKVMVKYNTINNYQVDDTSKTIMWDENYRLRWSDFKGQQRTTSFMAESNCLFAYRAEPIIANGILELHIDLNACFERITSWIKTGQERDTLLAHEQLHFDICELYIRQLRKKILLENLDIMDYSVQIQTLFNKAWNDYQDQQRRYDDETGHGIIADKQQEWQLMIKNQLNTF